LSQLQGGLGDTEGQLFVKTPLLVVAFERSCALCMLGMLGLLCCQLEGLLNVKVNTFLAHAAHCTPCCQRKKPQ